MPSIRVIQFARFLLGCALMSMPHALPAQTDSQPDTHVIEVEEGVSVHVVDWGGDGPPLLFLPSWASTSHIYDDFAPRFTDDYHVLVMNKRGHGPSSRPDDGYTIPRLIRDIQVVLDALEIERVNLVGLSRAESLTTTFAARYPHRVRSLVYLSGPIDRQYYREFYEQQENLIAAYRSDALEQAILALCFIDNDFERPEGAFDDAANDFGVEWRENDPSPPYADVRAPALAFWSPMRADADQYRASCARWAERDVAEVLIERYEEVSEPLFQRMDHDMNLFRDQLRDAEIVEIPGAIYHTFVSHPDIVEAEMRRFLQRMN